MIFFFLSSVVQIWYQHVFQILQSEQKDNVPMSSSHEQQMEEGEKQYW